MRTRRTRGCQGQAASEQGKYSAAVKHLTMADKSLLVGDQAADTVARYAALLAQHNGGDTVDLHAVSSDGDEVDATLVLNSGTSLIVETTHSNLPEPDNTTAIEYMQGKIQLLESPPVAAEVSQEDIAAWNDEVDRL
jgi:hypothetical protein